MAVVSKDIAAPPDQVWRALSDGWLYPLWVVGATHIRDVDDGYPAAGAKLHHAVGLWPLLVRDDTTVQECDPPRRLVLRAAGWPAGEAVVELTLAAAGAGCRLTMAEEPVAGPGRTAHRLLRPISEWVLARRNDESLARLKAIIERRSPDLLPAAPDQVRGGA